MSGLVSYMKSQTLVLFLRDHKCYTYSNFWKIILLPHLSLNEHLFKVKPTYFYDIMSHHALISKCFEKKILPLLSLISLNPLNPKTMQIIQKKRIQYENIKKIYINGAHFGLLVQLKTLCLEWKNQECLQASIEGRKVKKEFLFSVYNMD